MEKVNAIGRRKAAVARVYLTEGTGNITIDKRPLDVYFPSSILQYVVKQPLLTLDAAEKYDIVAHLDGGGYKGQAEALRLAIARALVKVERLFERRHLLGLAFFNRKLVYYHNLAVGNLFGECGKKRRHPCLFVHIL